MGMLHCDMPIDRDLSSEVAPVSVPQKGKGLPSKSDWLPMDLAHCVPFSFLTASREVPVGLVAKGNLGLFSTRLWSGELQLLQQQLAL